MSVPSAAEITAMGFTHEMFGLATAADLVTVIDGLIDDHGIEVSGVLGAAVYQSSAEPTSTRVKRAIKFYVAADMCQNRINRLAQDVKQDNGMDSLKMRRQRTDYLSQAEQQIQLIQNAQSAGTDFAIGSVITSHFDEV